MLTDLSEAQYTVRNRDFHTMLGIGAAEMQYLMQYKYE